MICDIWLGFTSGIGNRLRSYGIMVASILASEYQHEQHLHSDKNLHVLNSIIEY
eukprot:m.300433 g.300433  ORF g.300433 m.300433 type:complete len:54 (+) comp20127_c0_seq1:408-569(+)